MRFDTYLPADILKPYIEMYAVTESEGENTYKVLPNTGIVIGFQFKGSLSYINAGNKTTLDSAGITGLHDSYRTFQQSAKIGTVLVYFKEAGAVTFFKEPIHKLFRESISLDNFMVRSELLILEEQLLESATDLSKVKVIEKFLISRMRQTVPDQLVAGALTLIHKSKGKIRIGELLDKLHTSQSPLEKRFRQVVGTSPKKFASIVRFKHALRSYDPGKSMTDLGYEAGFYDQAHFIKEFKNFTGETPESFFIRS